MSRVAFSPSPVFGQTAPEIGVPAPALNSVAGGLANPGPLLQRDLDQYLTALQRSGASLNTKLPSLARLTAAPKPGSGEARAAVSVASAEVQREVSGALGSLSAIYRDGWVHERELDALNGARARIDDVLGMRDSGALQMLPRDVRERLDANLFGALRMLKDAADGQAHAVFKGVAARDQEALRSRLAAPVAYSDLDLGPLVRQEAGASLAGPARYQVGDLIAVQRSSGATHVGVVVGREPELRAEFLDAQGRFGIRSLDTREVVAANPLKIGDYIADWRGKEVWVGGIAPDGGVGATARDRATGQVSQLSNAQLKQVVEDQIARVHQLRVTTAPTIILPRSTSAIGAQSFIRAGGAETAVIDSVKGRTGSGGLFTSRGPTLEAQGISYKDHNEDAAVLGVIPAAHAGQSEVVFGGAFDEAGGGDHVPGRVGAASQTAAQVFEAAAKEVAGGADPVATLTAAAAKAHQDVSAMNHAHGITSLTTIAAGLIKDGEAFVLNVGDSQVYLFGKDGRLKAETEPENLGDKLEKMQVNSGLHVSNIVMSAIGQSEKPPVPVISRWKVEPGDYLVFGSDGLSDANLSAQKEAKRSGKPWTESGGAVTAREIGQLLSKRPSAAQATEELRDYALTQMGDNRGKPDNLTVVVVKVGP